MNILLVCNYKPGAGGISGQVETLQRMLQADGHRADIFSTKTSLLRRMLLPWQLRREAKAYDVVHIHCCSHWGFLPATVGIPATRRAGKRVVLTYHGGGAADFFDKHSRLVRHYLTRTDANIVLSGFLAKVFDKHGLPHTTIPNIVEADDIPQRQRTTLMPNFICTRAHEPLYNIGCILRAFRRVQAEVPEATLTLVGDGSEHSRLQAEAADMGLRGVTFTGRVDNSEIFRHLDRADILLSSPTVDNMPVSLLEAMNAGLLVISSRVGGVPFMVKNNQSALLFGSDNDEELAKKMLWALKNQTVALSIARQGHRTAARYRWENIAPSIYSIYSQH